MSKKFFPDDWEKLTQEEMINARARLSGFIESTTEKEKTIRDVSIQNILYRVAASLTLIGHKNKLVGTKFKRVV